LNAPLYPALRQSRDERWFKPEIQDCPNSSDLSCRSGPPAASFLLVLTFNAGALCALLVWLLFSSNVDFSHRLAQSNSRTFRVETAGTSYLHPIQ